MKSPAEWIYIGHKFISNPCGSQCLNTELSVMSDLLSKVKVQALTIQNTTCTDCSFDCSPNRTCEPGFVQNGVNCYFFSKFTTDFISASRYCTLFGAKLAVIEDVVEDDFIRGYALSDGGALAYYIGGSDLRVEGTFYWESPLQPVVYANWHNNNPDNAGGNEHCMEIRRPFGDYSWNDFRCTGNINFICEKTISF